MADKPVVIISSTARDLPEYRKQVIDACHRADMSPEMMERLPALPVDAIRASLDLVDKADVYVGVFAHRYGYVPEGHDISITQMEYERAIERGIPRLIFIMHDEVPVAVGDIDFESKSKLDKLKERLKKEQVVAFFNNPDDLRGHVLQSLFTVQKQIDSARTDAADQPTAATLAHSLHYVSEIPQPPEPYIAHPYTLLQVRKLVGRKTELELLTDWVTGKRYGDVRIFNVVAIGGMGKSALTWTWFNDIAPQEMTPLAGRMWWSFYESDATFENFVTRALAHVSRRPLDEVKKVPSTEQEDQLRDILDREPFLLVLDGLERILTAYARLDAAYLRDEDALDEETADRVAGVLGLPVSAGQSFVGKHRLRMTADPRAGRFLRELARVRASRILASSRLYPADLQAPGGSPTPGCFALFLTGPTDHDALELWRMYGAKGSRDVMLPVFQTFDKHPLLIQLLAREVAEFRDQPGDFDAWKAANPDFNPFGIPLVQVQSHVLVHAFRDLSTAEFRTLHVIAGFRMPASMDALKALLIHTGADANSKNEAFLTVGELDTALTRLEDRGLLGWDRRANRYDLHPIVRGVVWSALSKETRIALYESLRSHFEVMPTKKNYVEVEGLEDLTPAIELYHTLIGLKLYDEALNVFVARLDEAMLYRLSASQVRRQLLEGLFPDGPEAPPLLNQSYAQGFTLNALAQAYQFSGLPHQAVSLFQLARNTIGNSDEGNCSVVLCNLSAALHLVGQVKMAETSARAALVITHDLSDRRQEAISLEWIGLVLVSRGALTEAKIAFRRCLLISQKTNRPQSEGLHLSYLAQVALAENTPLLAQQLADRAWELAGILRLERDFIRAARLQGTAALYLRDYRRAGERLHHTLLRARSVSLVEQELPTLVALAELHRRQAQTTEARVMLDDVWESAEHGPYPLFHADALNVLAQIERDAGNTDAAVEAATKAYRLAWCDGPPFAYHWGLEQAKGHLAALGAPEPELPPFDESQHEPMPEVEINPPDEFGGDDEPDEDMVAE